MRIIYRLKSYVLVNLLLIVVLSYRCDITDCLFALHYRSFTVYYARLLLINKAPSLTRRYFYFTCDNGRSEKKTRPAGFECK